MWWWSSKGVTKVLLVNSVRIRLLITCSEAAPPPPTPMPTNPDSNSTSTMICPSEVRQSFGLPGVAGCHARIFEITKGEDGIDERINRLVISRGKA